MAKNKFVGIRITEECDIMLEEIAGWNSMTEGKTVSKSEVIRRIFLKVPEYHKLIPEEKLKEIRGEKQ